MVDTFAPSSGKSVKNLQKLLKSIDIKREIVEIQTKYVPLCSAIKQLESRKASIVDILNALDRIKILFDEPILQKLNDVIDKNEGLNELRNLDIAKYEAQEVICLNYAPITSVEVERSFSIYKNILTDERHQFTEENSKKW